MSSAIVTPENRHRYQFELDRPSPVNRRVSSSVPRSRLIGNAPAMVYRLDLASIEKVRADVCRALGTGVAITIHGLKS